MASYSTTFPNTENPISESGNWTNGLAVGLDWGNCASGSNLGYGLASGTLYADATALLTGTWGANQQAQATCYVGSPAAGDMPECELRLRSALAAHSNTGYEISFSIGQGVNGYVTIIRWNGARGDFTVLAQENGAAYNVVTGDVIKATIIGSTISAYKNGTLVATGTDSTYASGNPGMGFNYETAAETNNFGFSAFSAQDGLSGGSLVVIQTAGSPVDNATSISQAFFSNVTAGNLLVVAVWKANGSTNAPWAVGNISKSAGTCTLGSWTLDKSVLFDDTNGTYLGAAIFSAPVTGSGSCTVACALGGSSGSDYGDIVVAEVTGVNVSSSRLDGSGSTGTGNTGTETTGSFNTSGAGLIVAALVNDVPSGTVTFTPNSNFSALFSESDANNDLTGSSIFYVAPGAQTGMGGSGQYLWTAPTTYPFAVCAAAYKSAAAAPMATYFGSLVNSDGSVKSGTKDTSGWDGIVLASSGLVVTCPGSGNQTIVDLSAYVASAGALTHHVRVALYSTDRSVLIASSSEITVNSTTLGWFGSLQAGIAPNPATIVGGTNYCIVWTSDHSDVCDYYASGNNGDFTYDTSTNYVAGFPGTLPAGNSDSNVRAVRCGVVAATGSMNQVQEARWWRNPYMKYFDMNAGNWRKNNGIYVKG